MKVALVHDDLIQWGGAERVLAGLCQIYPQAPIFTSIYDRNNKELARHFQGKKIITSGMQKIPYFKYFYKSLFPFYSLAFEQFDFSGFDLVISQSTRFAKSIITKPRTLHVCYCHTPPRFLWDAKEKYPLLQNYFSYLRIYDQISCLRVDHFIAGSKNAGDRIWKNYHQESRLVYPFVDLNRFIGCESFDGGYFLLISRLNKYKRVDLAIEACADLKLPLKIIGKGPKENYLRNLAKKLGANIDFLGNIPDDLVNKVLAGAKALIICAKEDFGITSLEAQALGKPVVAYGEGGALETVISEETGFFFKAQTAESLKEVILKSDFISIDSRKCKENAQKFSKTKFLSNFKNEIESFFC